MANLRVDKITSTETFETTGSVQFDGTGDYLSIPNNADFRLNATAEDFTIECWAYHISSAGTQYIVGFYNFGDSRRSWSLYFVDGSPRFNFSDNGTNVFSMTTSANISQSQWVHVAVVKKDSLITLYINGEKSVEELYNDTFLSVSEDELRIGCDWQDPITRLWNGHISNLRIIKGKALYTANFKPSMKELEVTPETVLLCCQHKTDASLEKTGKIITVNANTVANELTPGILTPIVKSGGGSAITGSVEFVGYSTAIPSGGYLQTPKAPFQFLHKLTDSWTVECWIFAGLREHIVGESNLDATIFDTGGSSDSTIGTGLYMDDHDGDGRIRLKIRQALSGIVVDVVYDISEFASSALNTWHHLAVTFDGSKIKTFINGVIRGEVSYNTESSTDSTEEFKIGADAGIEDGFKSFWFGFISNFRIVKGTALYTHDFIPPTRELKRVPGTVLLCCQDSNDPTQEVTGKTISLNGIYTHDTVVNSGITTTPRPSRFTPQVGDDRKVTFEGVTKINSDAYFYLPTGDTITRDTGSGRGLHGGGTHMPGVENIIEFINIATSGNALDFGDLTVDSTRVASCSSKTRGIFAGGDPGPGSELDDIGHVTIASTGNALIFGDLTDERSSLGGCGNSIRGLFGGGDPGPSRTSRIDFITIATTADAIVFGDLTAARYSLQGSATASSTRGLWTGGNSPSDDNIIDYVTIASAGNAIDFGDTTMEKCIDAGAASDGTRAVIMGGQQSGSPYAAVDTIQVVTIASTGNAVDFGNLTAAKEEGGATSNSIRAVYMGGGNSSPSAELNSIDYVIIQTGGSAIDFGDLSNQTEDGASCSDSHGGLG